MPNDLTLRAHQEAIVSLTAGPLDRDICQAIRWHAVAALDLLNNAESDMFDHPVGKVRLVPDYQPGIDLDHMAPGWREPDPERGAP